MQIETAARREITVMERGTGMDIRQYGPALFPTLKQVRRILDEESGAPGHARPDSQPGGAAPGSYDEARGGIGK